MIKSSGIDEKIWLDFPRSSSILYQYTFKFSILLVASRDSFAMSLLAEIFSVFLYLFLYLSVSVSIAVSFPARFLPFSPLLLPEFVSVDSTLSCGGFVSRSMPARY
jgi:hypothetical protein